VGEEREKSHEKGGKREGGCGGGQKNCGGGK